MTHRSNAGVFTQVRTVRRLDALYETDFKHSVVNLANLWPKHTQINGTTCAAFKHPSKDGSAYNKASVRRFVVQSVGLSPRS